jgi:prevent-host-death family protein
MNATLSASDFKARCLELFDQLAARKLDSVTVTKRGRPVAVIRPPELAEKLTPLYGFLKGSVRVPARGDPVEPALDEPLNAELGKLLSDDE